MQSNFMPIQLDRQLNRRLKILAAQTDTTVKALVDKLVREYLDEVAPVGLDNPR